MSNTNAAADAWEDDWETAADVRVHWKNIITPWADIVLQKLPTPPNEPAVEPTKVSSKVTKAQRRAQTLEFNRQLWAEAYGSSISTFYQHPQG